MKKVLLIVLVIMVGVLGYAATRPDSMRVERQITINAPAEKIFPLIRDFHNWTAWSPYEKLDPQMKKTFSGPQAGTGAVYEWAGNSDAGQGRMEITDEAGPSHVTIKLDFSAPFEAHNTTDFLLAPQGGSTTVTWAMEGDRNYMMKVMGLFADMDTMIGRDFEAGLANLKTVAEK
jgi:carbon monoxide dehydrogenase subunit G